MCIERSNGQKSAIFVKQNNTVSSVKSRLEQTLKIPAKNQHLEFGGEELKNEVTLEDCGIGGGCHVIKLLETVGQYTDHLFVFVCF